MKRLAFIAIASPHSKKTWSGIPYSTMHEMKSRFPDFHVIDTPLLDRGLQKLAALERWGWLPSREPTVTRIFKTLVHEQVRQIKPDILISIGAAHKIAVVEADIPIVHVADALFPTIVDYYPKYKLLTDRSRSLGLSLQSKLVRRVDAIALASDWALCSALHHYPHAGSKLHVVPFGANVADASYRPIEAASGDPPKLLFVGYDWGRKNGKLLLEVFTELRRLSEKAELHIVGCSPSSVGNVDGVHVYGPLRQSVASERELLQLLFRRSSFFVMLSDAGAFGIAYCEACAFGLPPVAKRTGGVETIIKDGINGLLIAPDTESGAIALRLLEVWNSQEQWRALQVRAREQYVTRLNWSAWGEKIEELLIETLASR